MSWKTRSAVSDVRRAFLHDRANGTSVPELCAAYGIRRSTAYKLLARVAVEGIDLGVMDRSRAPHGVRRIPDDVAERVLSLRGQFPKWGPSKLKALFEEAFDDAPSRTSIANLLRAYELARPHRRRRHRPARTQLTAAGGPNDVWAADHKGAMRHLRLEPLTVVDLHSRFWLCCRPLTDKSYVDTRAAFEKLFDEHGLPLVIRVDAGQPWASLAPHRLTKLSAWLLTLGVRVEVVSSCQQNGCVERLHGTMEREMDDPDVVDVRAYFEEQRALYNEVRPHHALNGQRPADAYAKSPRRPTELKPDYGDCDDVRRVQPDGSILWRGAWVFVSEALTGHRVGLRQLQETQWLVRYYHLDIGVLDDVLGKLTRQ